MAKRGLQGAAVAGPNVQDDLARFLEDVEKSVALPPTVSPVEATTAVLGTLLRRLSRGEARHLWEELPEPVRDLLSPSVEDRPEEPETEDTEDFLRTAGYEMGGLGPEDCEEIVRVVFAVAQNWLPKREEHDIASQLPKELREMWLNPVPLSTATARRAHFEKKTG